MVDGSCSIRCLHTRISQKCPKSTAILPADEAYTFKRFDPTDESRFTRLANEGLSPPSRGQVFLATGLRLKSAALYIDRREALLRGTGETVWARIITHGDGANDVVLRSHGRDLSARDHHQVEFYEPFVYAAPKELHSGNHDAFKALILYAFAKCGHVRRVRDLKDSSVISALIKAVKAVRRKTKFQGGDLAISVPRGNDFPHTKLAAAKKFDPARNKRKRSRRSSTKSSGENLKREEKRSTSVELKEPWEREHSVCEHSNPSQLLKTNSSQENLHEALELAKIEDTEDHHIPLEEGHGAASNREASGGLYVTKPILDTASRSMTRPFTQLMSNQARRISLHGGSSSNLQLGYLPNQNKERARMSYTQRKAVTNPSQKAKYKRGQSTGVPGEGTQDFPIDLTT
ncbi:hypothetical protein DM02DRAFT_653520 [Periconia macrospinosa]|uniref:Uncharacterized protein n=1 Tax=Periconia macrospinosa TaxID=97972 RepID=A0A2V1DWJ4_9PLEO|nr:hypothetical protein DM02DRAFT_653520 [Periconia macrospinosa]